MDGAADWNQWIKVFAALLLVLSLMGGLAIILRRLGLTQKIGAGIKGEKQLQIIEALPIDPRRRLILVQRGTKRHLVLTGPNGDTLVERDIAVIEKEESDGG